MRNFHGVVVDDIGQVIGRVTVRLQHDEVVDSAVLEDDLPIDRVGEPRLALKRHLETHHRHDTGGLFLRPLLRRQAPAIAVIAGRLLAGDLLLAHRLQALRRAVAVISVALSHQPRRGLLVKRQPLGLKIRPAVAPDLGPLIPLQAEPAQPFHDVLHGPFHLAGDVRILDAQDEPAAGMPGKQPVEHGGADAADVGAAGGAGGEADTYGRSCVASQELYSTIKAGVIARRFLYNDGRRSGPMENDRVVTTGNP